MNTVNNIKYGRIYGRFSSAPQEKGTSKERQIEDATKYAKEHGIEVLGVYFDEAVSGKAGANLEKEFGRLLEEVQPGEAILVEFLDRMGRQHPAILNYMLYQLTQKGVTIIAHRESKIIDAVSMESFETQISTFTNAALGNQENKRKKERLRTATQLAYAESEKGIQTGVLVRYLPQCYLWDATNEKITIDEDIADVVREIFKLYCDGTGTTTICKILNQKNVPTFYAHGKGEKSGKEVKGGKKWNSTTIARVLRNESYAGVLHVEGRSFTCIPPVISRDTWDKAQMLIQRFAHRRGKWSNGRVNNLFRGIAVCADCGATMNVNISQFKDAPPIYMYQCYGRRMGTCKNNKMMNAAKLEMGFFMHYFGGSTHNILSKQNKELKEKIAMAEAKIKKLDAAINNLFDMVEAGDLEAKKRIAQRRIEKAEAERELVVLRASRIDEKNLPTAIEELNYMIPGSDEEDAYTKEWYAKLEATLADNESRKKLAQILPSIFSKVVIDTQKKTVIPYTKAGEALPMLDVASVEPPL